MIWRWRKFSRMLAFDPVPARTLDASTVWLKIVGARNLSAADKTGTSDAFAVAELVDGSSGQSLSKARNIKTKTVKKTLNPAWSEETVWSGITENVSSLALKVVVSDADVFSSEVLGTLTVPLADFVGNEGDLVTHVLKWYTLDVPGGKVVDQAEKGEVQISLCVQAGGDLQHETLRPAGALIADTPDVKNEPIVTSTLWFNVSEAKNIAAADGSGTSDAFAVIELFDLISNTPVNPTRKKKTKVVKKSLSPNWEDGEATWTEIAQPRESLALKVTIFDADVLSSQALGSVLMPLSDMTLETMDVADWHPLSTVGKVAASGFVKITYRLQQNEPRLPSGRPVHVPAQTSEESSTIWLNIAAARNLPAADKNGTSDAYAVGELVDALSGKPLSTSWKVKTKTAKRTLNPVWESGKATWTDIKEDARSLALKLIVFDSDTFSSEAIGGLTVPLSDFVGQGEEMVTDSEAWYPLDGMGNTVMESGSSSALQVSLCVQAGARVQKQLTSRATEAAAEATSPTSEAGKESVSCESVPAFSSQAGTVWVKVGAARNLRAADKNGTSDPYAVAELVHLSTGKALKLPRKTKTKTAKKTLNPVWDLNDTAWGGLEEDIASLALKVTILDADILSSDMLGTVTIPLSEFVGQKGGSVRDTEEWHKLQGAGSMKPGTVSGEVQIRLKVQATDDQDTRVATAGVKEKRSTKNYVTVSLKIHEARDLVAADKGGTSDPYAVAELVSADTGKPLKKPCRKKTRAVSRTLHPVWSREEVTWEHVEVAVDAGSLDVKVTLFDNDMLAKDDLLGGITVPLAWGSGLSGTGEQWYPLTSVGKMVLGAASGQVKLSFRVESTDGPVRSRFLDSKLAFKPLRLPTWEERLAACQKAGGIRLDFSRLKLGDPGMPKTAFSPALGLGGTLVGLNLKGNALSALPTYVCKALPMLRSLVLSNNFLTHLPDDLALLKNLEVLAIDANAFEKLPPCVFAPGTLGASLLKLHCGANKLTSLPPDMGNLVMLESLVVAGNGLTSLPVEVAMLAEEGNLKDLDITGNPCALPSSTWDPPAPLARLLGMRTIFRSQSQRSAAIERSIALRKHLNARRTAIGAMASL